METKKKLSGGEKFAYGIGAVGKDMVYLLSATYILYYYLIDIVCIFRIIKSKFLYYMSTIEIL